MILTHYVHTGDNREYLQTISADSFDSIVTDPPYGLGFMGKAWDHAVPGVEFWAEFLRVAKPGAHLVAFGGTRLYHRMTCAIEDAGWEIRDSLMWLYGTGFPKSLDVAKAIDKSAGKTGQSHYTGANHKNQVFGEGMGGGQTLAPYDPETDLAKRWAGYGTALKPAWEPIILARKPLIGTVVENVTAHGTGGINVDGCRIGTDGGTAGSNYAKSGLFGLGGKAVIVSIDAGRFPANLLLDESAAEMLAPHSRFFYCAKASVSDREEGLEDLPIASVQEMVGREPDSPGANNPRAGAGRRAASGVGALRDSGRGSPRRNIHPTVKPTELMRWLCRLVTPAGGKILDPFTGSGSTGKAAVLEGFDFVGCEMDERYAEIARKRIEAALTR